jgi:hypothetical protein
MSKRKRWRRYEILLPLLYNDKRPVPRKLLVDTIHELRDRFAAVSSETQVIHGRWVRGRQAFRDDLIRVYVDAEETPATKKFFAEFKEKTRDRFRQTEMWLTSHPIDVH